jgi:hypothetical protein
MESSGRGALRQHGLIKRTVITIIFKVLFIWEQKNKVFIGRKCQNLVALNYPYGVEQNPPGVLFGGSFTAEQDSLDFGCALPSEHWVEWVSMALKNCNFALHGAYNQRRGCALGCWVCVCSLCVCVCVHAQFHEVYLGLPFGNGLTGIFLPWKRGSLVVANTVVKLDFVGVWEADASSLVELRKAVGGCLFPLRRDVVCWRILNYCDSVKRKSIGKL